MNCCAATSRRSRASGTSRPCRSRAETAAIREPWRIAASYLTLTDTPVPWERWEVVRHALAVNAPLSTGMGRLFDAVAAVLGLRDSVTYEGQAAIELEQLAGSLPAEPWAWRFGDAAALVTDCHLARLAGHDPAAIAAAFHETIAEGAAAACEQAAAPRTVALSGGSFQNLRLLASTRRRLEHRGFRVLSHRAVPPNDGGISYGQAAVAAARSCSSRA